MVVGQDEDGEDIEHTIHEYHDTLQNIYLGDFKESIEFEDYCRRTGKNDISFSTFRKGARLCPCIQAPTMRVCVDELETGFSELVFTLKEIHRRSPARKRGNVCCAFCTRELHRKDTLGAGK